MEDRNSVEAEGQFLVNREIARGGGERRGDTQVDVVDYQTPEEPDGGGGGGEVGLIYLFFCLSH